MMGDSMAPWMPTAAAILGSVLVFAGRSIAPTSWRKSLDWTVGLQSGAWLLRITRKDPTILQDASMATLINLFLYAYSSDRELISTVFSRPFLVTASSIVSATLLGAFVWKSRTGLQEHSFKTPFKPLLFPCKTTHYRLFPKKHGFAYSYLLTGVPVGWKGTIGSLISVDEHLLPRDRRGNGWFHVRAMDYLERGGDDKDLKTKLTEYLQSQGVTPDEWKYAYLVTAAKFIGYSFNPVSFWYIYSADQVLKYMLLEVNNTFDERRMYLRKVNPSKSEESDRPGATRYTDAWEKDFHVSPFNSRKGSYAVTTTDPFESADALPKVDATITLKSSKDHSKLVARIFSTKNAIDPARTSLLGTLRFLASWWWVGFVTFPRILREAMKLFFQRKLHVWFRPEVLNTSIGRHSTDTEQFNASVFEDYIVDLVSKYPGPLQVTLISPVPSHPPRTISSQTADSGNGSTPSLTVRVLTPAFYSRLLHYPSLSSAIAAELLNTDIKNRTIEISSNTLLSQLLASVVETTTTSGKHPASRWRILCALRARTPPPAVAYSAKPEDAFHHPVVFDGTSVLDDFVRNHYEPNKVSKYRRMVYRYFISLWIGLGFEGIVGLLDMSLRSALIISGTIATPYVYGALSKIVSPHSDRLPSWLEIIVTTSLMNSVHLWEAIKG